MRIEEVSRFRLQVRGLNRRLQRELPVIPGLTFTNLQLLVTVYVSPTAIRPSQLAKELEMSNPNVSTAIGSLEALGLVVRRNDPADGRKAFIEVTSFGRDVIATTSSGQYAWLRNTMKTILSDEEQRLLLRAGDLMQRITDYDGSTQAATATLAAPLDGRGAKDTKFKRARKTSLTPERAPAAGAKKASRSTAAGRTRKKRSDEKG